MAGGGVLKDRRDLHRDENIGCEAPDGVWGPGDTGGAGVYITAFREDIKIVK